MNEKPDCLFCQVIKNESDVIYQDQSTAAFLDIFPVEKAHILVVPKKHSSTWIETSENDIAATNIAAQKIAKKLLEIYPDQIKGFNIIVNNGREADQMVFHYHIHVIPKFSPERGFKINHIKNEGEIKNLDQTRKLLKQELNRKD